MLRPWLGRHGEAAGAAEGGERWAVHRQLLDGEGGVWLGCSCGSKGFEPGGACGRDRGRFAASMGINPCCFSAQSSVGYCICCNTNTGPTPRQRGAVTALLRPLPVPTSGAASTPFSMSTLRGGCTSSIACQSSTRAEGQGARCGRSTASRGWPTAGAWLALRSGESRTRRWRRC